MKTIGLIGGMSWESTVSYYQTINRIVAAHLGGLHSAKILLYSVDFAEIEQLQMAGRWTEAGELLAEIAARLEAAGADFLVLCTNTMHKLAGAIESRVRIPLLHIADPTADAIVQAGFQMVGLLGTRFTMEQDFYKARLAGRYGLKVLIPDGKDIEIVHRVIYDELCHGKISDASRIAYRGVMARLCDQGAQCIILGCTEIGMLVGAADAPVLLVDTTALHARAAALRAIGQS